MGDKTKIQWTDATWNPIRGCSRVSAGCEHCYAEQAARRFSGPGMPYEGLVRLDAAGRAKAQWNGTIRLVRGEPYTENRRGDRIPFRLKLNDRKGGDMAEWPEDLRVREMPTP